MLPPLFFAPPTNVTDDLVTLPPEEARHVASVMRLKSGQLAIVVDGLGTAYRGELQVNSPQKVSLRVHSIRRDFGEPSTRVTLAAGLSTGYKFDTLVQKGTELGIKRFVPLLTSKSKVKLDDPRRARTRVTRLEKVALSAIKQCRRSYRPEISLPTTFAEFMGEHDSETTGLIFHPGPPSIPIETLELSAGCKRLTLLIGPESGFSEEEISAAIASGYRSVSLGERILRTETAGPVIAALIMARLGELS